MLTVDVNKLQYSFDSLHWTPFEAYKELKGLVNDDTEVCIVKNGNYAVFQKGTGSLRGNCRSGVKHGLAKHFKQIVGD